MKIRYFIYYKAFFQGVQISEGNTIIDSSNKFFSKNDIVSTEELIREHLLQENPNTVVSNVLIINYQEM